MTVLRAHFDGKVLVPDEPVDLPVNCALEVRVRPALSEREILTSAEQGPLTHLIKLLEDLPDHPDTPADGASQHDHYLYGHPKRP